MSSIKKGHFPSLPIPCSIVSRYKLCSSCFSSFKNHPSRVETQTSPVFVPALLYFFRPTSYGRHLHACRLYVARTAERERQSATYDGCKPPCGTFYPLSDMISDDTLSCTKTKSLCTKRNLRHIRNFEIFIDFKDFVNKKF